MSRTVLVALGIAAGLVAMRAHPAWAEAGAAPPAEGTTASPAERKIEEARRAMEKSPGGCKARSDLALALARRARETSDPAFYARADEELEKCLAATPDDTEALKVRGWLYLGQHRFAEARDLAVALNKRVPDDVMVYGLLNDAQAELGNYAEAEAACNWMLDLRPGNVPALTRAAYLRELFGDVEGALELMSSAYQQTPPSESEDQAWILTQVGHLHLTARRLGEAEAVLGQALAAYPGYHYALAQMAHVRTAQGRNEDAVDLLRRRYAKAPHAENLYDLAEALDRAGHKAEARAAFAEFERKARAEMRGADNANRELIYYYADHAHRPAAALALARSEVSRRRDVQTVAAYAWALHRSGRAAEARKEMKEALAVGTRDPELRRRAAAIARGARRASTMS
jgi:tetratricopeptide (TPR) repeat protein